MGCENRKYLARRLRIEEAGNENEFTMAILTVHMEKGIITQYQITPFEREVPFVEYHDMIVLSATEGERYRMAVTR